MGSVGGASSGGVGGGVEGGGSGHSGLSGGRGEEGGRLRGLPFAVCIWGAPVGVVEEARGSCGGPWGAESLVMSTRVWWEEDEWKNCSEVEDCEARG